MTRRSFILAAALVTTTPAAASEGFARGSWAALRQRVAGQPAIVHFWSLTCAPCMVELPQWPDLARRLPGVAVILINTDPPDQSAAVARAAQRAGLATLRQYAFAETFAARLRWEVDPDWQGELPRTDLLDRDGRQQHLLGSIAQARLLAWAKEQVR